MSISFVRVVVVVYDRPKYYVIISKLCVRAHRQQAWPGTDEWGTTWLCCELCLRRVHIYVLVGYIPQVRYKMIWSPSVYGLEPENNIID